MSARSRSLVVAIVSGVGGRMVAALSPILVMAPMLDHIGPVLFGTWIAATAMATILTFLDFGVSLAATTHLSDAVGRADQTAVRRLLGEAYALLLGLTLIYLGVIVAGTLVAPLLVPDRVASGEVAVVALVLTALFLSQPAALIWRFLQARQNFAMSQLAQVAGPLIALTACLLSIRAALEPVTVIAFHALSSPLALALWTLVHFARNPNERPQFRGLAAASMRRFMALGGAFFTLSIFTLVGMNADNVIVAARAGSEVVAEYGVPAKLGGILMLVVGTLFMPLWSMFGNALAQKDHAWLRRTTLRMSLGGAAVVLLAGLALSAFADPIMTLWMGRPFADQHLILLGWTVATSVIALTAPYNMVLNAAGQAQVQILPWVAFVIISVAVKIILLGATTAWLAPWITAVVYFVTIAPFMIGYALKWMQTEVWPSPKNWGSS